MVLLYIAELPFSSFIILPVCTINFTMLGSSGVGEGGGGGEGELPGGGGEGLGTVQFGALLMGGGQTEHVQVLQVSSW